VDSPARPALIDLEIVNENWVNAVSKIINETDYKGARGFVTLTAHVHSEIVNENWFAADSKIIT